MQKVLKELQNQVVHKSGLRIKMKLDFQTTDYKLAANLIGAIPKDDRSKIILTADNMKQPYKSFNQIKDLIETHGSIKVMYRG